METAIITTIIPSLLEGLREKTNNRSKLVQQFKQLIISLQINFNIDFHTIYEDREAKDQADLNAMNYRRFIIVRSKLQKNFLEIAATLDGIKNLSKKKSVKLLDNIIKEIINYSILLNDYNDLPKLFNMSEIVKQFCENINKYCKVVDEN